MKLESRFRLMAGILAIYCWSCSHDSPMQPPIKRWPVRGTVEDRLSSMPIEGAALKFFNNTDSANTTSNNRGWFEVQLLAGDYFLAASKTGHLAYRDTIAVAEPGVELRVQLVLDPAQDYLPLAVGNWWEYDDNTSTFSSGIGFKYWGTRRWEIISSSIASNRIIYVVRVDASGKQTRTYPGPLPTPYDTTDYAYTDSFEFVESDGQVALGTCTALKHIMQPGDKIASRNINSCDSSRVSAGMPMIVNGLQIETLEIDAVGFPSSERTWAAVQVGIVLRDVQFGVGNTRQSELLRLRQYFIHNVSMPK